MTRDESLHILQHALGLDNYGQGKPHRDAETYRNHFVASEGHHDWELLKAHVAAGRMEQHAPRDIFGGERSYCFTVTEAGREYVRANSPKPPKRSRAQQRYAAWLQADCGLKFGEWLRGAR